MATAATDPTRMSFNCPEHGKVEIRCAKDPKGNVIVKGQCPKCEGEGPDEKLSPRAEKAVEDMKQATQARIDSLFTAAGFGSRFKDKIFDNYNAESNEQKAAVRKCKWFLKNMDKAAGLIMVGPLGVGKNHLCAAITHEVTKKFKRVLKTTVRKLDRAFKESWKKEGEKAVLASFMVPDILIIDEVGFQRETKDELLHVGEVVSDRYDDMKPTILVSNAKVVEIPELIGGPAYDRFKEGGTIIALNGESYRVKAGKELLGDDAI